MGIFDRILRAGEGKRLKRLQAVVPLINQLEPEIAQLDDAALRAKTAEFRQRLEEGETLEDLLVEAFAVVREAARRAIGQRHYDVQLLGGMALHFGWIAEMQTGEGKTLVSTLPAYLNALEGKGVHIVTVNDYLAARDAAWMGRIYAALGMTVGRVGADESDPAAKRAAYLADITYGTNTEFGFDYLRDNMATSLEEVVQRPHHYAIVDEVDSILIDEARTPLIISGPSEMSPDLYYRFASIVRTLRPDVDYEIDEEKKVVLPTEAGIERVERALGVENLYDIAHMGYLHQLTQALRAKHLYLRDRDYIVDRGEVKIVDEFTGRILEGRRWSDGLHQAVEAKERVRIQEENHTWATVTLQNYFRLYDKLAGMTGTAQTEAAEFASTYGLQVVPIPTNRPVQRVDRADLVFKSELGKFGAVVEEIAERSAKGQPVLVGTVSVAKSELLSSLLAERGISHAVLNAKYHAAEAEIIAQAGRLGAVTVATNMAGRGVDILLGGNPEGLAAIAVREAGLDPTTDEGRAAYEEALGKFQQVCADEGEQVRSLGGLYVIGSERHESRRIDNQLRGRSGRQGDPGETRFFLSLEDELMRIFAGGSVVSWVMNRAFPEDQPIEAKAVSRAIERAQATVEARNADIRKDVLKYDQVLDEQRKVIYARRREILEGEDLSEFARQSIERTVRRVADVYAPGAYGEDWDLAGLVDEARRTWGSAFTAEELADAQSRDQLVSSLVVEALELYDERERALGADADGTPRLRALERDVLLGVIDQHWRDHLIDMDYLREGINLRAMGQQDPLVAWQQEGFEMFQELMRRIEDDFVRYLFRTESSQNVPKLDLSGARYFGATDPQAMSILDLIREARDVTEGPESEGGSA
ncbi:preprotein translocase, SecA subunit [Acidimicrobium ferrooxidans DSM 10331]|uniref:Protein translocase subunit SecA n=1 Tax=Acidimicrobium ferrooxidans (strain DSM 10331 / JCM 15462 / NBRC 103882 / ICP) TaxID=525909 RepID=C7M129_ACIFD|nr:preprotein translocase subunit SecA [Acidimicrobium ferrooxidans]ACU54677.1 preprotein translocase, SecA subunit [Acidimicrobium ferrooxidans DSM 10331]